MSDSTRLSLEQSIQNLNRNELNVECQQWALAHGFVQRCFTLNDDSNVIPYPFTIYPSSYPRNEYEKARQIQYGINRLVQRLASNMNIMDSVLENLIDCDPFLKRLRQIYDQIQQLPYQSIAETCIIRTDYMLQQMNTLPKRTQLRLIEINTIAIGLGAAAKLMYTWHKKFLTNVQSNLVSQLPENESQDLIIETLFESWKIYDNTKAIILFVIPEREFNIGDQMLIEQGLLSLYQHSSLLVKHIWQAYIMLESSRAIKCPSLRYHLAGMKCFQLALTKESFLEEIFQEKEQFIDDMKDITEEMFTIEQAMNDPVIQQRILDKPESFYLKQSREGGGNVYCGPLLKERLEQILIAKQSKRYFLMSRIYAPIQQSLIRSPTANGNIIEQQINSELGIFGSLISQNERILFERTGGYLLRSKPSMNIEGGIASGQGYIDSIYLI
ncbi:hypothetical protein I4U23_021518 [Adineta vaga]|nr:hypothetical protein I4U23_021518 [Adineta vaga]